MVPATRVNSQPIPQELDAERDESGQLTGRLNHPVLFVHGYAENATGFGVQYGEEICADPRVLQPPVSRVENDPNSSFGNWPFDLVTDLVLKCRDGAEPHVSRKDRITTATTVGEMLRASHAAISVGSDRTSVLGRTFLWSDWIKEYANLRVLQIDSQVPVKIKHAQHKQFDRLMSYSKGSIPDVLARNFSLDQTWDPRAPDSRINRNGIYVFSAKMDTPDAMVMEDCRDPRLELVSPQMILENSGDRAPPLVIIGVTMERSYFNVDLHYSARISCSDGNTMELGSSNMVLSCSERPIGPAALPSTPVPADQWKLTVDAVKRVFGAMAFQPQTTPGQKPLVCSGISTTYSVDDWPGLSKFGSATHVKALHPKKAPDWTIGSGTGATPGQAQDLYNRMKEVLDSHYGAGVWQNDPSAQIDLVAHSQGGLVVRAMLSAPQARTDATWANPIRHIRRVVTLGTPHFGTAIATSTSTLRKAAASLDASLEQRSYPNLADMKDQSWSGACVLPAVTPLPSHIDMDEMQALLAQNRQQLLARIAFLKAPPAGCLALSAELPVYVDKALPDWVTDPFVSTPSNGFHKAHLFLVGPLLGPWKLTMADFPMVQIPDKNIGAKGIQDLLSSMANASHLGWPDGANFTKRLLGLDEAFPQYPGTATKIPLYTFASPGVGSFVSDVFQAAIKNLKAGCPSPQGMPSWFVPTSGPILFNFHKQIGPFSGNGTASCRDFQAAMDTWATQAATQFAAFDLDWSKAGDIVVEAPSQRAIRGETRDAPNHQWMTTLSPELHSLEFRNTHILHGISPVKMSFADLDPNRDGLSWYLKAKDLELSFPSGPMEGCDVAANGLGVLAPIGCHDRDLLPTDPPLIPKYLAGLPLGAWAVVAQNPSPEPWLPGWNLELPIVAASAPAARLVGSSMLPEVLPAGDSLWTARFTFPDSVPQGTAYQQGYPLVFVPGSNARFLVAGTTTNDGFEDLVVLRTRDNQILSGTMLSDLDQKERKLSDLTVLVHRGDGDAAWFRPMVDLRNLGTDTLEQVTLRFLLPHRADGVRPEVALWNVPWPSQGSISLSGNPTTGWVVEITLKSMHLPPGASLTGLLWGAHWPDWAAWPDPTLPMEPAPAIWASASIPTPIPQIPSSFPETPVSLVVEAKRDPSEFNLHRLRIRVTSTTPQQGFQVQFPLESPPGIEPVMENWWPTDCSGVHLNGFLTLSCPAAELAAGAAWPDQTGASIGLHDRNWYGWSMGSSGLTSVGDSWVVVPQ